MTQPRGPAPTIISAFRRAAALMVEDLVARLHAAGFPDLTPSHHVVFENLDPAGTRLTELAARAGITHQSMSELVSVLEQRGYLERLTDPGDGRARIVRLTGKGRRMTRRAMKEIAAIEAEWSERLGDAGLQGEIVGSISKVMAIYPALTATSRPATGIRAR
jgi:DNA-binding MarR family transcriptional regulator